MKNQKGDVVSLLLHIFLYRGVHKNKAYNFLAQHRQTAAKRSSF